MYNVTFAVLYNNLWDKCRADDGILKLSQTLGKFMMETSGDYLKYGEWSDGRRSKLHDQQRYEF